MVILMQLMKKLYKLWSQLMLGTSSTKRWGSMEFTLM
jgi:hypothetical protein